MKTRIAIALLIVWMAPAQEQEPIDFSGLEPGVYVLKNGVFADVYPEVVNWKTGGVLKMIASGGIVREDINARISAHHSMNKVATSDALFVVTPEATAITEYQLIRLREHLDSREFRMVTGGVFHVTGGTMRDAFTMKIHKSARHAYRVFLTDLSEGEYGLLPPGAFAAREVSSIGKMYTFEVEK